MEFELEKLRIQTTRGNNDTSRSTSNDAHYEIRKLMPKYESKDNDLSFYLILFERQAKRLGLDEDQWAFSLLGLLPYEMTQLIARETEEQSGDYRFVKRLLLKRYKLSPEQFRQKFEKHERSQKGSWRDFAFELRGYFNEWIEGMNVENFDALKDLSVTNQLKKKVPNVLRNHLIDDWTKLNNPDELADKLDEYENVRTEMEPPHWNAKHLIPPSFQQKSARFPNQSEVKETKQGTNVSGQDAARNEISETYPNTLRRMVNRTIRNDKGEPKCFNCNQFGHIARDCPAPRTTLTCRGCGQTGHKERNCTRPKEGLKVANLEVEGLETVPPDVYLKDVKIDNKETVKAMIDTGSSSCLMRESVARRISVDIEPDSTSLYGIGNQTAPAARTVGKTTVDLEIDGIVGREITVFVVNDDAQPYDLLIGRTWTDLPYVSFARIGKNLHIGYSSEFPFANLQEEIKSRRIELRATETVQLESDSINFTSAITDEVKDGYVLFTGVDDACVDSLLEVVDGKTTVPIISTGKGKLRVRKNQCVGRVELLNLDDIVVNLDVAEDSFQTKNEEKREGQDQMKRKRPILPEDINVNHSLTSKERQEILDVVNEYRDCFAFGMEELGCTDVTKMDIKEVDGSKPVCLRPYKTTASEREAIREIVREWKDNGIVTETRSPYASPVLLVRKKTGDHRLVVDYRRLNIQTVKDKFPLPRIDDLLEGLRNAKFFTTLDLAHGYLQIPLTDKAKLKTAFITPDDTGQFERMIFGLANAPAEFQRLMHTVLGPLLNKKAFCYLDDVIIPAKDWREMIERLREVLERIRSAKLTLKPSKCEFGRREVEFLGYVISTGGLKPGPRKIKAIEEFPEPKNVHDIRRFLGLTNFFRRFVKDFARKAEPLSRLTKKGSQFEWKEEQRRSFGGLRKDLVEYPVLPHYNPELKTEVHCDASAEGLAGMVLQMDEDCKWRLVYCVSKKTTEAEKMYHSSRLELMAIVWTLDRLRQFIVGIKFTVVTDFQALVYMNAKKTTNPQIARWYNLIQEYDFEIRHKPGEKMAHVDGMSRAPVDDPRDTMEEIVEKNLEVCLTITLEEQILMIQHSDPELRDLIQIFRKDPCDRTVGEQNRINDYSYKGGRLFRMVKNGEEERALYVIPKSMSKRLVVKFHDLMGHFATDRTVNKIKELYWFPSMKRYVRRNVAMCLECLFNKVPGGKQQGFLHPIKSGKRPFSIVHMDHVGPFVRSTKGNQELLVIVDNLTRFVRLSPVRNTSTQNVLKVMKSFVNDFGLPDKIISDRGSCFTSRQFEEFCRGNGIHHTLNSTKHPQGNGMVERVNRTVLSTIATSIEDPRRKDWDLKIKEVERDLNNAVNKTTNKTPFETLHGYSPRFHDGILRILADEDVDPWTEPDRIQESVRTQIENKQEIMKTYYDKKKCRTIQFEVGEIVVMRHVPKMTLSERTSGRFYTTTAHISQLKSWHSEEDDSATEESPDEEPEVEDTPRRNPRRSCNARFNRGRLKSRNGRIKKRLRKPTILRSRLNEWVERRNVIPENQAGYRRGRSCVDLIFTLTSLIQLSLRKKRGKLYVFFVDLRKAFDTVPHSLLWKKLTNLGVSYQFIHAIRNYYEQATVAVRWRGSITENIKIHSGVLQGEPLSPLLFILFMTDLIKMYDNSDLTSVYLPEFGDVHLLMYADDIAIIGESRVNLQKKINILKEYLGVNEMTLNESKSKVMVFRNGGKPSREDRWYWNGKPLMVTRRYIYLGYPLVSTTKTTQAANFFKGKALAAINATTPILEKSKINSLNSAMKLFDSIVMAVLMYAAPIWATEYKDLLDHIQDTFIRRFLNLPRYTPGYIIRPETGRVSLIITALKLTLKYWLRVLSMDTNRLPRICLTRMRQLSCATDLPLPYLSPRHILVETLGSVTELRRSRRLQGREPILQPLPQRIEMEDDHRPTVSGSYLPCQRQRDPSTFSGDGNINPGQWLKEYERVSKYNRWDETLKLANVEFYLNGTAGRWFNNNEESLNSWRSFEDAFRGVFGLQEDSARRAEEVLKSRAQKTEESSESYIQEILSLCHQVNPRMEEGEIVAHIIKGISEDTYQVLVAKDIQRVDEILKFCRHLTTVKQRRIGRTKFARLSNVMPISCVDDSDDLAGLIRRIVREEIQKVFSAPEVVNPLREVNALEQTVREEVSRALQPTRPQVNVVQQQPRTPYYNIDRPTQPRNTEHWRTYDDKPICFHCGRPGHVVRYCRERRQVFAEARSRNGGEGRNDGFSSRPPRYDADDDYVTPQTSTPSFQPFSHASECEKLSGAASNGGEVAIEENPPGYIAAKLKENFVMVEINGRKIKALVDSGADFSVISDKFRRELKTPLFKEPGPILKAANKNLIETLGKCVLNIEVNGLKISFEFVVMVECSHDIIFGCDFFKATEAVIDCGKNELHLGETSVLESREEETQRLFASDDFVIPPKSIKKISVINEEVCGVRDVLVSTTKDLLLRKEVLIPNSLVTFRHGRGSIWVAKGASWPQLIPSGMNMCTMESYENGNICSLIESSDKLQETQLKSREWSQKINLTLDPGCLKFKDGLYEFQVMPFGLCNAPATFERMIDSVLGSLKWNMCLCYLDDIVVYAPTFEEHLRRLQLVLICIQKAGLSLNHKKCLFGSRRIKILGQLVDANGIHPDPDKVEAVSKFPRPRNISELKSFLGLCSYYQRFIENFADKARSFHDLLKTEKQFYWDAAQEKAFEVLKTALISEPVLGHFDESADTHLHTDASGHGIGAVLLQIQGQKDPSGRLSRWALKLQEFDVTVIYKSRRKHKDADCLSRSPLENDPPSAVMSLVLRTCKKTCTYVFPRDAAERDLACTETFDFSTPNEWPKWRKRFERYLVVSGMKKKEEADMIDLFMYLMGDRADDIFRAFKFEKEEEATKIDSVLKAFDSHFCVRKNIIYERAKFNSRIQEDREPVDEFITSLYKLADSCEFEGLHEQLIRDRIVVGVRDKALSKRMQLDSELTLEKAVKMVRQQEAVRQQQVDLQRPSTSQKVNQVKFNSKKQSPKQQQQPSKKKEKSAKTRSRCPKYGGFTHREGQACRAEGQKCNLCSKTGHFANCCPDKQAKTAEVKAVSELDEEKLVFSWRSQLWRIHLISMMMKASAGGDGQQKSKTMTPTEKRYAQIEKEALAITWACERFQDFLLGKRFRIETDHKPLIPLFSTKELSSLTPRLQRFRMRMMRFGFEIVHIPGKELLDADALSRQPLLTTEGGENERQTSAHINAVISSITYKDEMLTKIFEAQQEDTTLKAVVNYLEQGWPDKKKMSQALLSYWHVKGELGVQNGLLMRSCRLVIPASMKLEILEKLHAGYFGITKTRLRARETVWWPGISEEIAETVRKCSVCIQEAVSKHEPLIPTNFPTRPWQKIGMDLFKFENKWYLVVIDYYSRFPEMVQLDRLTASVVVRSCKSIFARHGVPETVVSDNGTQFGAAREFENFARQYGFTHVTSSPRFPQSNGMAEAGVKIAKMILKKNLDPSLGLLEYRSTPLENGYSPAELLMGRKLRTTLPIAPENLNPKLVDSQTLKRKEGRRRKDMKSRYDRRCGATDMEELSEGDTVWITDMRTWGIVKQKASTPRSYMVDTPVGTLRRNRFHLRKGVTVQYPADPSTPTFSGEELVENEKTPVVDYPSNDSEDGQIRTRKQTKDPDLAKIIDNLNSGYTRKEFSIIDGILYKKNYSTTGRPWLMMIPKHLRSEVMADLHDAPTAGHLGFARTYDKVKKRFYWPGLYRTVRQYVSHCRECQRRKKLPRRPAGQLVSIPPVEKPFHKVGVDLLGRFPVSKDGNRWIIVCTDYMTRYAITKAFPDGGAIETAKFLVEDVILKHGAPREMITEIAEEISFL
ncbi:hypothetical protein LAZ67_9002361, partial [Cordylochernes scorpioides]